MPNKISGTMNVVGGNRKIVSICFGVVFGMVGLAYASVPVYQLFSGYGGTPQTSAVRSEKILAETMVIRFDANVANDLGWSFRPEQGTMTVRIGETNLASYRARSLSEISTAGTAVFNVTPVWTGVYFYKIECFCYTEQVLAPGENAEMSVEFYVDPEIVNHPSYVGLSAITLSYTFFPLEIEDPARFSASDAVPDISYKL